MGDVDSAVKAWKSYTDTIANWETLIAGTVPHYHPNGETEIYIVLQGSGLVVVGGKEQHIEKGSVIVTPSDTAHFTIPAKDLVLAVINTPSFNPENYIVITETNPDLGFDKDQFTELYKQ